MCDVFEKYLSHVHGFTDDTQLHLSFKLDSQVSQDVGVTALERCIADIRSWMINDRLLLNDDTTEVLLIGTRYQLNKLDHNIGLRSGDNDITLLPVLEF